MKRLFRWFERVRGDFLYYLKVRVFKIPEGADHPLWFLIIRCLIFPSQWLDWIFWARSKKDGVDFFSMSHFVNGVQFSYEFFRSFIAMETGDCVKIRKVSDEFPYFELERIANAE